MWDSQLTFDRAKLWMLADLCLNLGSRTCDSEEGLLGLVTVSTISSTRELDWKRTRMRGFVPLIRFKFVCRTWVLSNEILSTVVIPRSAALWSEKWSGNGTDIYCYCSQSLRSIPQRHGINLYFSPLSTDFPLGVFKTTAVLVSCHYIQLCIPPFPGFTAHIYHAEKLHNLMHLEITLAAGAKRRRILYVLRSTIHQE
jgi:hypothetical protein